MNEPKRAGRFRLFQSNGTILFFLVWHSTSLADWAICEVKRREGEFTDYPDRKTKRVLSEAMWARLVTWC